ncbi:MAG TPA: hypothetical protein PLV45_16425, partial [bacterium]|nr:hypothetical protein [bacterium]
DFGLIRGMTPAFCSPEQMAEEEITPATDIWSWALVVMLMWFEKGKWMLGPQAPAALDYLRRDEWGLGPAPESLIELLTGCLHNDASRRPATALRIAEDLKEIYQSEIGCPYPRPDPPELTPSSSRRSADAVRASVVDGIPMKDPRELLREIKDRLDASSIDVESLIPEVRNPPETFIDNLHVYLFIEDILRRVTAEGDPDWLELLSETLKRKAWILFDSGDPAAAIASHEQAVEILKETILWHNRPNLWKKLAEHWSDIAFCHLQQDRPKNAVSTIRDSAKAMDKVPDSHRSDQYYFDLQTLRTNQAIISALTGDPDAATVFFQDALAVLDHVDADAHPVLLLRNRSQGRFNLGTHFEKIGERETAIRHFHRAIRYQDELLKRESDFHDRLFMGTICQNLAVCLTGLQRNDAADFFFRKAGTSFEKALSESDHHFVHRKYAHFLKNYAYFHYENGDLEHAVELAQQALSIMTTLLKKDGTFQYTNILVGIYKDLATYYEQLNLPDQAREYQTHAEKYERLT